MDKLNNVSVNWMINKRKKKYFLARQVQPAEIKQPQGLKTTKLKTQELANKEVGHKIG